MRPIPDYGGVTTATQKVAVAKEHRDIVFIEVPKSATPKWVGACSIGALGVGARGSICTASKWWSGPADRLWIDVLDMSNPASPRLLGEADSVGGCDIHLSGPFVLVSGSYYSYGFAILNIRDTTRSCVVSQVMTPNDRFGVMIGNFHSYSPKQDHDFSPSLA